jgi:glycosyltransferase involved in cell wall biosynthesis
MKLSVLVSTVTPRASLLSRLLYGLTQQTGDFEVLVHPDDTLGMGDKLNRMFAEAEGEYVVCVDDDDMLADSYMDTVLPRLAGDFVGYRILVLHDGKYWMEVEHRWDVNGWGDEVRGVGPKCPVRRDIACRVPFGNAYSDDEQWSAGVAGLVSSGVFIDRPLYVYDWWNRHMLGTAPNQRRNRWKSQRDVGVWPFDPERVRWIGD